jgi:3-deoxy-D-manno-octulosonic-acid transferase
MRGLYDLLLLLVAPFLPLRLWWRGRKEPGYRRHIGERFGRYHGSLPGSGAPLVWLHAVSLGETRAAAPLVSALQERFPDHRLLVTQMTATGREAAESLYGDRALVAFLPYDFPWAVRRFLARFRPRAGIVMETEVWPNLLRQCRRSGVPVLLANARLSERSARGYARIGSLAREAFGDLALVGAQAASDAERFRALGARDVEITGNLKFDVALAPELLARGRSWRGRWGDRPVLLLASSRDGEEALVLDAIARVPLPARTLLLVVPRHPQRFDEVAALLERRGVRFARRSQEDALPEGCNVVLGDSLGEMPAYYAACDVAVIGGSLLPFGSQNLIEACAAGAAAVLGPSTFNFAQAATLAVEAGAAVQVGTAEEAVAAAWRWARRAFASPPRTGARRGERWRWSSDCSTPTGAARVRATGAVARVGLLLRRRRRSRRDGLPLRPRAGAHRHRGTRRGRSGRLQAARDRAGRGLDGRVERRLAGRRLRARTALDADLLLRVLREQAIDADHVLLRERPRRLLELQPRNDGVVARRGEVAPCGGHLLLGVQHVDVDAHPHLVADAVGRERHLARRERLLEGPHLGEAVGHGQERALRVERRRATRILQVLPCALGVRRRLAGAREHRAA